ncbi:MAG: hypothetical protein HY698_02105 [Deltaproteobacteria bacterium]|nr:hypothetical protein [Deltaproteobacteria bacterium]
MRTIGAAVLGILLIPHVVGAQGKPKCADDSSKGGTNYEIVRGPDGKKIFKIKTGFCIEGKVPKPSVIYVLNSSTINYEWENLKQDFLPKVINSVEQSPF